MNRRLPELHDFFGAYFHQDWLEEHDTAEKVIDAFIADSNNETIALVIGDLQSLLEWDNDEKSLRNYLLRELSCYYCYWNEWESGKDWLNHLEKKLNIYNKINRQP
ncbi:MULTISPECIES: contact-dependent growth inhibition system immunity protein [unclassified Pseudomonas]|uniref:contact-dependent growth inhibition system immunity protein n=1 Tax=unclassified Pseudomonas TaxID=196821 RepID=UPI000A1FBE06|nr:MULTISPECIES: contact-dependent growth inhibition system immunity protein [unclassified Pseudomonas]